MADCERLKSCPFFNTQLAHFPRTAEELKLSYCLGDNSTCARHLVALAGLPVPPDLFPNEADRAEKMLRRAGVVAP